MVSGTRHGYGGAALCCAAWLAGVLVHLQAAALPPAWALVAGAMAAVLLAAGARSPATRPRGRAVAWAAACALMGWSVAGVHGTLRAADALPAALEQEEVVLEGVVASLPRVQANGVRFTFDVRSAMHEGAPVRVPSRVSLAWYTGFGLPLRLTAAPPVVRAGEVWRLTTRLRRPHGLRNPHGGDPELHLFEQGVRATGSVRPQAVVAAERLGLDPAYPVQRARQHVRDALFATVADPRAAGVLAALSVGDQSAIERDDWQVFRDTGVAHLMSISGLHVTLFAWLAGRLVAAGWSRWRAGCLAWPAARAGDALGLLAAATYAVFSGGGVPAQRTVWMLAAVTLLRAAGHRWPAPLVLGAAAVVVSAVDPWALLQAGFWLSFAAVGLLSLDPVRGARGGGVTGVLRSGLRTQAVATVALAPLTLVLFHQVSVVGFAANLVAIPVVTFLATPLALAGVAWSPAWLAGAAVVRGAVAALEALASWPGAVWTAAAVPVWVQAAGLLGAAVAVLPLPWRLRALAVPLVLPLVAPAVARPLPGRYEVVAADVGQGTAVLVRTATHLLVYDTGPPFGAESNAGDRVLLPLLRARGERRIHRLVLSHRDADHVGGAPALLDALPVEELFASLEPGHALQGRALADRRCDAGFGWTWDGVRFDVLHPPASDHARPIKPNARSCVVRVSGPQGSVLLTGDIEREQEARLVAAEAPLDSDVLLVPHHGSRTSSTAGFLAAVSPTVAVVQAGHLNRFGHPVREVLDRLAAGDAAIVRSARCGAWSWDGAPLPHGAWCERHRTPRYWQHPDGLSDAAGSPTIPAWISRSTPSGPGWPGSPPSSPSP